MFSFGELCIFEDQCTKTKNLRGGKYLKIGKNKLSDTVNTNIQKGMEKEH